MYSVDRDSGVLEVKDMMSGISVCTGLSSLQK